MYISKITIIFNIATGKKSSYKVKYDIFMLTVFLALKKVSANRIFTLLNNILKGQLMTVFFLKIILKCVVLVSKRISH